MSAQKVAKGGVDEEVKLHRIRITLTSRNVPNLEKGACVGAPCYVCTGRARGYGGPLFWRSVAVPLPPPRVSAAPAGPGTACNCTYLNLLTDVQRAAT